MIRIDTCNLNSSTEPTHPTIGQGLSGLSASRSGFAYSPNIRSLRAARIGVWRLLYRRRRGWLKTLANGSDHHHEPVEVQTVKNDVTGQIRHSKPSWHRRNTGCVSDSVLLGPGGEVRGMNLVILSLAHCYPNIIHDRPRLICAVYQTAGEERRDQQKAVIKLRFRAGQTQLVEEPVDV